MSRYAYVAVVGFTTSVCSLIGILGLQMSLVHERKPDMLPSVQDAAHVDHHVREMEAQLQLMKDHIAQMQHRLEGTSAQGELYSKRLQRVENDVQRVSDLQEELIGWRQDAAGVCPPRLSDISSKAAMAKAGWRWVDMNNINFVDKRFLGWADDRALGIMELRIRRPGKIVLRVKNVHFADDPENMVQVWLNVDMLSTLRKWEEQEICFVVEAGDILTLIEFYGQIFITKLDFQCTLEDPARMIAAPNGAKDAASRNESLGLEEQCVVGEQVWLPKKRLCHEKGIEWYQGKVDRVLNETRAIIRLNDQEMSSLPFGVSQYRIVSARHLRWQPPLNGTSSCASFEFTRQRIGIVLVADLKYQFLYSNQIQTQRCYAAARGYEYVILEPSAYKGCSHFPNNRIFYLKHCIISEFLRERPGYIAVVIDADVVAAVLDRGLEEWTRVDADIHFYERIWCREIAAGNYIVRGTPWASSFLMQWANYSEIRPPGFASEDNGIIHLHIVKTLQLEGAEECEALYFNINGTNRELEQYFRFVNCTKDLLGPPRLWQVSGGGKLAYWGKTHFFVDDGVYLLKKASSFLGPVFHHGIKDAEDIKTTYYSNLDKCELNTVVVHRTREQYSEFIMSQAAYLTGYLQQNGVEFPTRAPQPGEDCAPDNPWKPCLVPCLATLSCPLLGNDDAPKPVRTCTDCT
mmetsp:Transcript_154307/g.287721  ORF Transcript_154307/g.287721 Transcript_154307/m.287721 type:complete len:689 (+) Transcript_154307:122-2188(+)